MRGAFDEFLSRHPSRLQELLQQWFSASHGDHKDLIGFNVRPFDSLLFPRDADVAASRLAEAEVCETRD